MNAPLVATPAALTPRFRPIIRVFVSSTFSDLVHERNALQDRVWPELERYCLLRGFQFQVIDLRWGVPTEAGLDHRTMRICMEELRRSQEVSPQPNFLVLLGDRYGWQPLPEEISTAEFEVMKQAAADNKVHLKILEDWYRRDGNARPPVYLLRSRRDSSDKRDYTKDKGTDGKDTPWSEVQKTLWSLINRVYPPSMLAGRFAGPIPPGGALPPIVCFQGSATEQEIWHGVLRVADADQHVLAFSREIGNLDAAAEHPGFKDAVAGQPGLKDFVNIDESGKQIDRLRHDAVRALKTQLRQMLGENYLQAPEPAMLQPASDSAGKPCLEVSTDHVDFLCTQIRDGLLPIIQQQIDDFQRAPETAAGAPLSGEVLRDLRREREEHLRFAAEHQRHFLGRANELSLIGDYLADSSDRRPLVVHGPPGAGKTANTGSTSTVGTSLPDTVFRLKRREFRLPFGRGSARTSPRTFPNGRRPARSCRVSTTAKRRTWPGAAIDGTNTGAAWPVGSAGSPTNWSDSKTRTP